MPRQFSHNRVSGTPEALELIESLKEMHGPVAFFQAGSSCDESEPLCLTRAELLPEPEDVRVGEFGGAPVYIEARRYERWGRPDFLIDVADGRASGISLSGLEERHFITRTVQSSATGERASSVVG